MNAPNRPPDRVSLGPLEEIPGTEHTRRRFVAEDETLFKVLSYREIEETTHQWGRRRVEYWDEPEGLIGRWEWVPE